MNTAIINKVKQGFINEFNLTPLMIFSSVRLNIIGEHTDYDDSFIFPTTVDKGIVAIFLQKCNYKFNSCSY